jgi:V8-like Glu-specific endopeptidase
MAKEQASSGASVDRPEDPLFMPHIEAIIESPAVHLEGAAVDDDYPLILETICGATDDSQPVEQYDGTLGVPATFVNAHQAPVAQVQWNDNLASIYTNPGNVSGARWGSGTMISRDLFLTAGHLFDQTGGGWERPRTNGTTNIISPQEIALNMRLNFNYQVDASGTLRTAQSFPITQLVEYRLGSVDFAICRISGNPGNTFGWTDVATADAALNDMLCVMGHPAGVPKRIEAGPATGFNGNQILYNDIDTLGGNSGSGILSGVSGQLVGVHTNGGCNAAGTGSNFGQRITAIRRNSPTLQSLVTATTHVADVILTAPQVDTLVSIRADDKPVISDIATTPARDVIRTTPLRDKPVISDVGTRKTFDDVKAPALDKQPGFENKAAGFDNPVVDPGVMNVRPFVLSTPHHADVHEAAGGREHYEALLAGLQAAIADLSSQYEAVAAEYEQQFGPA